MLVDNKQIAIVGGGPSGLILARLLQIAGAILKVYERDLNNEVRLQGATLDLHKNSGLKTLEKAGLMESFKANYRPGADKMRVLDNYSIIYFDDHTEKPAEDFGQEHFRPEIDRGPLRKIMLESLQNDTVVWNSHFDSMQKNDSGWTLLFKNSTSVYADIVIGADGANSKIRPYLTSIKPIYSGITMIEGTIYNLEKNSPIIHRLLKGGKLFALGNEKMLIVSSKAGGDMSFYTSCKTEEGWFSDNRIDFKNKEQLLIWFNEEFTS